MGDSSARSIERQQARRSSLDRRILRDEIDGQIEIEVGDFQELKCRRCTAPIFLRAPLPRPFATAARELIKSPGSPLMHRR